MGKSTSNLVLAAGYAAVAVAILVARQSPASGYEASIYAGTPAATWIALAIALAVAVATTLTARGIHQAVAIGLGGLSVTTIVSLPILRGYYFLGKGDALTHLGWVRDFLGGGMLPHELLYPGLHSVAAMVHLVTGAELPTALLIAVVVLFVPFVIFVPLIVREVTGSAVAVGFAAILAWFILPINNVATHMGAHSNSNALFFAPVVIFAIVAYVRRRSGHDGLPLGVSPFGALLVLSGVGLLFVHPQQMINVVIILGAIAGVQFLARWRYDDHPMLAHQTTYAYTVILGAFFAAWVAANERFRDAISGLIYGLFTAEIGGDQEVDQREASLAEIGGSIPELFAKMFLVSAIVGLLAASFLLVLWIGRSRMDAESQSLVTYLGVALFPLGAVFAIYFVGTPTMAFRQIGFIYVLLTILGGIALAAGVVRLGRHLPTGGVTGVAAIFVGACLVLALLTAFGSPFIYNPTQHVSEQSYAGYETALDAGDDRPYAGYGYTTYRYNHGIYGPESMSDEQVAITGPGEGVVDAEEFNNGAYADAYPSDDYYLVVSEWDTVREFEIYQELNYERDALDTLATDERTAKYVSNEEFALYAISDTE